MKDIRHQYTLPGKYRVKVVWLTDKVFKSRGCDDGWSWWDTSRQTIYLRKSRTGEDELADFMHEMEHAATDWREWFKKMMTC